MSLVERITQTVMLTLTTDLAEFIADRFGLDSHEVSAAIKDYMGYSPKKSTDTKRNPVKKKSVVVKPAVNSADTCIFEIKRGKRAGQVCGTKVRGGGEYCSKHRNHAG